MRRPDRKIKGCGTTGIAGGADKVRMCRDEFRYDAAVDDKADDLEAALAGACPEGVRDSVRWVCQQLMEAEVSELIGAEHGERNPERLTHRNGYRPRPWQMRAGEIELAIRLRRGSYFPSFLEPRRRSEQALASVVQEKDRKCLMRPGRQRSRS